MLGGAEAVAIVVIGVAFGRLGGRMAVELAHVTISENAAAAFAEGVAEPMAGDLKLGFAGGRLEYFAPIAGAGALAEALFTEGHKERIGRGGLQPPAPLPILEERLVDVGIADQRGIGEDGGEVILVIFGDTLGDEDLELSDGFAIGFKMGQMLAIEQRQLSEAGGEEQDGSEEGDVAGGADLVRCTAEMREEPGELGGIEPFVVEARGLPALLLGPVKGEPACQIVAGEFAFIGLPTQVGGEGGEVLIDRRSPVDIGNTEQVILAEVDGDFAVR